MKKSTAALFSVALSSVVSQAAITVPTTGVYDVDPPANAVDAVAGIGLVTPGSAAETALNSYKTLFANAFANGKGGVIQFDGWVAEPGDGTPTVNNVLTTTYGGLNLNISRATGNYQFEVNSAVGTALSGTMYLRSEGSAVFIFNFSQPLDVVGFTALSRASGRSVDAVATLTDGSTMSLLGEALSAVNGADDTFFGFTAPEGKAIVSLVVTPTDTSGANPANPFIALDDLGYVVSAIPEPSAAALVAAAGLAGIFRRRREH